MSQFFPEHAQRFGAFLEGLKEKQIAVIGHARPDGDCIGSQVALARILRNRGHDVICVNPDAVPRRLQFLVGDMRFIRSAELLPLAALLTPIFVDCADHARAGEKIKKAFPEPRAAIDHHISNVGFARENFIDPAASATCEILGGMFMDLGIPIDFETAQALYAGIVTDTGQFRFNSTTRKTFEITSALLAQGVVPAEICYHIYERESLGKIRLLQRFLSTLHLECGGRACVGRLPLGVFHETGSTDEDTEGLVDYARMIDGVDIGVLIEERPDHSVKASLRAKDPRYRVDLIAGRFGGGGHACAAGLNLKQDTENFYERLVAFLNERLEAVDKGQP